MPSPLTRRHALGALAASAAVPLAPGAPPKKPVALVMTEYRTNAHADVIGTRLLEGYEYDGKRREPRVRVASMFADQKPHNDMSRAMAAKHKVMLYDTVYQALTLGGDTLAVAGVVLIGEHGNYPYNEKLQHLYPRFELFSQVVDVFKASGRTVPVFCDKHLSVDWAKAKQMYDWSRELKFPLMAGSSLPICWRKPALEIPWGAKLKRAVTAHYGGAEAYGFHSLEMLQVMAERRAGGETGVNAVQVLSGAAVWEWTDANPWAAKLLDAAVARSLKRKDGELRANVKKPELILTEYKDGLQGASYLLNGHIEDFNFAAELEGKPEPVSTCFWLQPARFYGHFSNLCHFIEEMMLNGRAPYPVERTLLTTGVLAAAMESAWRGGKRIETSDLGQIAYLAPKRDPYARGPEPTPEQPA
jgi:hypothetical protein